MNSWMNQYAVAASWGMALTGGLLILWNERRLMIVTLALQYFLSAWLIHLHLPIQIAAAKFVTGLLACTILSISLSNTGWRSQNGIPRAIPFNRQFRLIAVLLVFVTAAAIGQRNWMTLPGLAPEAVLGSTMLMGLGLLHLGISEEPIRVGIGILTLLAGFEISYSAIEPSLAVIALLALVHMGLSLVIGYLLIAHSRIDKVEESVE